MDSNYIHETERDNHSQNPPRERQTLQQQAEEEYNLRQQGSAQKRRWHYRAVKHVGKEKASADGKTSLLVRNNEQELQVPYNLSGSLQDCAAVVVAALVF